MALFETGYAPVTTLAAGGTSSVFVAGSVTAGSRDITLINTGAGTAYVGQTGVTQTTGLPVPPGYQLTLQGAVFTVYAVGGTGGTTVEAGLATKVSVD